MRLDEGEVADILARRDALRDARRVDAADRLLSQRAAMHVYVDDGGRHGADQISPTVQDGESAAGQEEEVRPGL